MQKIELGFGFVYLFIYFICYWKQAQEKDKYFKRTKCKFVGDAPLK